MSPRTGRPKIDNPKSIDVKVRIDEETKNTLDRYCDENNLTRAEAIRFAIKKLLGIKK